MVNPNGYIQGADGNPLELVDITARRQLAGKLNAPGGVKAGDYLRVQIVGAGGNVVLEGAEPPGEDSGQNLPDVTAADAGKFLRVSTDGMWAAEALTNVAEVGA